MHMVYLTALCFVTVVAFNSVRLVFDLYTRVCKLSIIFILVDSCWLVTLVILSVRNSRA